MNRRLGLGVGVALLALGCGGGGQTETTGAGNHTGHGAAGGSPQNSGAGGTTRPSGAGGSTPTGGAGGAPQTEGATWTLMVYANADNNLGTNLYLDLVEMVNATLSPNVRVFVYADFAAGTPVPGSTGVFPSGTLYAEVKGHDLVNVASPPEQDFDSPAVLASAVETVFAAHPADHYGLVLWDHGGAWRYGFGSDTQDGTRPNAPGMPFETVAQAVRTGLAGAGLTDNRPLDFFAFNTCLLGTPEVASAFADLTQVYIASAEIDYGAGWDYQATLTWLAAHPTAAPADFARQEVGFWNTHHSDGLNDVLFKSHVALDTSQLAGFGAAVKTLVTAAQAGGGPDAIAATRAFDLALPDYYVEDALDDSAPPVPLKDVGQILTSLEASGDPAVAGAANAATTSLQRLVIAKASGSARSAQAGLNIGAGAPSDFTAPLLVSYRDLVPTWNAASSWGDLIDFTRGAADAVGPSIAAGALNGSTLSVTLNDPDLLSVDHQLWSFNAAGDKATLLQLLGRFYLDPGSYDLSWTGKIYALDATPAPVAVSLVPWREIATSKGVQVPILKAVGILESGADAYYAELLIDVASMEASEAIVYLNDLPNAFAIADLASPDVTFWPLFPYVDITAGTVDVETGETGISFGGNTVSFTFTAPPSGAYARGIQPRDTWGNSGQAFYPFTLP
jgi:hypothetical protein